MVWTCSEDLLVGCLECDPYFVGELKYSFGQSTHNQTKIPLSSMMRSPVSVKPIKRHDAHSFEQQKIHESEQGLQKCGSQKAYDVTRLGRVNGNKLVS
mmetsp:Transcript_9038/g.17224  ORF Transcript_9038/g.17224 Transcript_9038/m.17224 type:complete len:98 (-) Transcript_9038:193-486(-)